MEKYNIEIKETLTREISIEASSIDEAMSSAELLYNNEEIVLDYSDHNATDIDISNLTPFSDNSDFLTFVLLKAEKSLVNLSIEELAKIGFGNLSDAIKEYLKVKN
jgi:hypothetical protein